MIPWRRGCGSKLEEKREKGSDFQKRDKTNTKGSFFILII